MLKDKQMKYFAITIAFLITACSTNVSVTNHDEDAAAHQAWIEHLYTKYDAEYIEDCFYYELDCEFE